MDELGRSAGRRLRIAAPLLRAALVGDFATAEFTGVRRCVEADAQAWDFATTAGLLDQVGRDAELELDLVLVAQARPGEWDGKWLDRLRRRAPLVRIVAVLGTWCEGEMRTGRPLAADCRVYWHAFPAWWARQREALRAGRAPEWSFPDGHRPAAVAAAADGRDAGTTTRGAAVVAARTRDSAEGIATALRVGGWSSVWVRPPQPLPDVYGAARIVYDGGQLGAEELAAIADLRARYGPLPVVALADVPTVDRVAAVERLGTAAVIGKPYLVEDLLWAIDSAVAIDAQAPVSARCQRAG